MPARCNQSPQPRQCRAQHVHHGEDSVELAFAVRGGAAHAKAAHIHARGPPRNVFKHAARQNHARVGAELTGRIFNVLPRQARSTGNDVVIQKDQRLRRIDAEALEIRRGAVALNVVDAHEPGILSIGDGEAAMLALITGMGACHVVGNGAQMARFGKIQRAFLFGDDVATDQEPTIFHAMDVLCHLALAAAAAPSCIRIS